MTYYTEVAADAPVEEWRFDETSGTSAASTGSGAHSATASGTTIGTGIVGKARVFNGTSDYIAAASVADFTAQTNYTFEAWFKLSTTDTGSTDWRTIARRDGSGAWLVRVAGSTSGITQGSVQAYLQTRTITTGTTRFDDGNWHHVAVVKSGSTPTLYVDGVSYGSGTGTIGSAVGAAQSLFIGSNNGGSGEFYKGTIDSPAVYHTALTGTRISAHYSAAFASGGYTAQAMTASATLQTGTGATNGGYTAQAVTASATTVDATAFGNTVKLNVTEDSYVSSTTNFGAQTILLDSHNWYVGIPSYTPLAGYNVTKVELALTPTSSGSSNAINIAPITGTWSESTITSANAPAVGSANLVFVNWTANVPSLIDITGYVGANGVRLSNAFASVNSSEATTSAYRPYVVYTIAQTADVSQTPAPVTASAAMVDPLTSTGADVSTSATAMSASAALVTPVVTAERSISVSVESMAAYAETGAESGISVAVEVAVDVLTAAVAGVMPTATTTQGVVYTPAALTATAAWVKPSVNGLVLSVAEADDPYFQLVYADAPKTWWRLNDTGSTALDRMGVYNGTYAGVQMGQHNAPDGRASVHFDGTGEIIQSEGSQDESEVITDVVRSTLEFSFRTTKANTFILAGADSVTTNLATSANPAREVYLKNGKITYKSWFYPNSLGQQQDPFEFSGFKSLNDGEWHSVVIRGGTYRFGELGVEIWVDGKFEVRRVSANAMSGFPDYIGSRPSTMRFGYSIDTLPSSWNFEGDMSEVAFYTHVNVDDTEIPRHYYAFMGWRPYAAQPIEAFTWMTGGNTGKGNQKRALYLWWARGNSGYNVGGDGWDGKMNFDPVIGAKGTYGIFDYEGYKVFATGVVEAPRGTYRDLVTDAPSLIDLTRHVNLDDYDVIMFGDWPDEGSEIDYYESIEPGGRERLIKQLRDANDNGIGLMVTHPRLAVDLGVVDRVELVPTLREYRFTTGQGNASGLYDYGSAYNFPWNINGDEGLISATGGAGSTFNGVPVNRDPAFLATKAFYYGDTNKNDRFRVRALVEGLTDIPSYMIEQAVYHVEYDIWGWQDIAYKYLHRLNGLQIGDEYIYHGTDMGYDNNALGADRTDERLGRWFGSYASPVANVKAGTVVTTFGATQWLNQSVVDNPYRNYATTIVLRPGDYLAGRPVGGKIFVNFTEQPNRSPHLAVIQDTSAPVPGYRPETPEQKTWEYSFTRKSLTSTSTQGTQRASVIGPNGETISVTLSNPTGDLAMGRSVQLFPLLAQPSYQMVARGFIWLQDALRVAEGAKTITATPLAASVESPSPVVKAQHSTTVAASAVSALAQMPKVAEDSTGEVQTNALPLTASATITGYGKTITASPMTANAELTENFDSVHAAGEQIVLTLFQQDIELYIKEEV